MERGYTLLEILAALAILAVGASMALAPLRRQLDGAAVEASIRLTQSQLARARGEARFRGEGGLVVDGEAGVLRLVGGDAVVLDSIRLSALHRVSVDTGSREPVSIRFDALGVGRVASRTLLFRRGRVEERLVISSYGRVIRP